MNEEFRDREKLIPVEIQTEMKKSFLDYSMSVIVSRALPDVRDGLKPVHRRVLYAMHQEKLTSEHAHSKSAATVGTVMKYFHPHGDSSIYDALVRLAQNFSLRYPLVDGHGNFGSVDGDPPAAMRYTEARMAKISREMLSDIDKETVDYIPNYDDTTVEPICLPARFPNVLVNGAVGIAVGMATNIPPHNLAETIDAMCCLLDNPDAGLEDLMQFVKGPDFPTGGIIMGRSGIREAYSTGHGKITLRGKAEIEEENGRFKITITEIPYMVNKSRLVKSIAELVKDKRIEGISDMVEASDREGMRIIIDIKRDASPQIVLNQLYSFSQLQDTVGVNLLVISNGEPKVMTLKEILTHYIKFQEEVIIRRTTFDLKKAEERVHILLGLIVALDFIDEVINILRASKSIPEGKQNLTERFGLDDLQTDAIVVMRFGQLTGMERHRLEEERDDLAAKIIDYKDILGNEPRIRSIIKTEALVIRDRYNDPRRTAIENVSGEVDIESLIPVEDCVVTLTNYGYVKRQPADTYKTQKRGGRGVLGMTRREEDVAAEMFVACSHSYLLFVTNKGRIYRIKCYEIPESSRTSKGINVVNLLPLQGEESVTSMLTVSEYAEGHHLVFVTRKGYIKRTELSEFENVRKNGLMAITIEEDDELAWVSISTGADEFIVATRQGMAIRFKETDVRPMGRTARGVRAMNLAENDEIVGLEKIREGALLLTLTEKGYGRRTNPEDYRLIRRGGKGVTNYRQVEERGTVVGIKMVDESEDVILITSGGVIIRTPASQISQQSRYGGGVTVMKTTEESRVVTLAAAPQEPAVAEEIPDANDTEETSETQATAPVETETPADSE